MASRKPLACAACRKTVAWAAEIVESADILIPSGPFPPPTSVDCPECGHPIDTRPVFAHLDGFPLPFDVLRGAYAGFAPRWEQGRESLDERLTAGIKKAGRSAIEEELNTPTGFDWFRQRMFYRSTVAFVRSYQLFLSYLVLDRRCFHSWAKVTAYYSRFYFLQAFLNLTLGSWIQDAETVVYSDGARVRVVPRKDLAQPFQGRGSHKIWWRLLEAVKVPADYPIEGFDFVLTQFCLNPRERNRVNYDFEFLGGGFIELDWADSDLRQFVSHFGPQRRQDRDFTDVDRFFEASDPEDADPSEFYGDTEVQLLWASVAVYLRMLKALEIPQQFIRTEKLVVLSEIHLADDYAKVRAGLTRAISEILDDGYDASTVEDVRNFWRF